MCVNYTPPKRENLDAFAPLPLPKDLEWPYKETWQDWTAPIVRRGESDRELLLATYGIVPQKHIQPPAKKFSTLNARAETIGEKRSYAKAWRTTQLCLIPMMAFFEPNHETGKPIRWAIGMADDTPFAVAGLWRAWHEPGGETAHSFTQITINADEHPLMKRFHKPGDEKRSLVIIPESEYDEWLECRDPERARSFLQLYPAELMKAWPAPKPEKSPKPESGALDFG